MTTSHNKTIKTNMSENCDKSITKEYKIFIIINDTTNKYYISQTTNKYLSTTINDMKRRPTELIKDLFNNGNYQVILLETMKTDNLYYVKNKIIELNKKQTEYIQAKDGRGRPSTQKEKSECEKCKSDEEEESEKAPKAPQEPKAPKPKTLNKVIKEDKDPKKYYCKYCDKYELKANRARHEATPKIKNLINRNS